MAGADAKNLFLDSGLVGMISLHVDDMLGCGDSTSNISSKVIEELRNTLSFRLLLGILRSHHDEEPLWHHQASPQGVPAQGQAYDFATMGP